MKTTINEPEETIDNQLELLKYLTEVQSRIQDNINSDFVLAILSEKDKEGITEMTTNAYYTHKLLTTIAHKAKVWNYDHQTKTWTKKKITETEQDRIKLLAKKMFDMYMTRIYMVSILNRNVSKNYLMNLLAKEQIEIEKQEEELPKGKIAEFLDKFKGEEK